MFTVCPKCALTLIVTAADLRAGQGYVRCGRCANVFNALVSLSDDREPVPVPPAASVLKPPESPAPEEAEVAETNAEVDDNNDDDDDIPDDALEFDPSSTNVSEVFVEPEQGVAHPIGTGTFKMLVLRNADLLQGADDELAAEAIDEIPAVVRNDVAAASDADASTLEWLQGRGAQSESSPRTRRLWLGASAALVLVLVAQALHHYRNELAAVPAIAPAINGLYGALGLDLHPHWDLAAYDVRQLGAAADAADAGSLRLRASIANRAPHAQPLPLLRVTMQDRFGNPIASRDVAPSLYAGERSTGLLAAGQRVDAQVVFHDPGRNAVGFELDACLPAAESRVVCALGQKPH